MTLVKNKNIVFPELSYKIIGCAFDVFNEIGGGHKEIVYQKALEISLRTKQMMFSQQVYYPVTFQNVVVGRNYFDFLVDDKIIVEIKSLARFTKQHYDQVLNYLTFSNLKLALLITFGKEEVKCRRVVNFQSIESHS